MKGEGGIVVEHKVERTDGRGILAGDYLNQNRPLTRQDWLEDCFPEWGTLLSEGREFMRYKPYLVIIPGCFIAATVLALNLAGDGLRDALDPRLKK